MIRTHESTLCASAEVRSVAACLDSFSVVSPRRSAGGQRRYSRRDISAVQYVVRLTSEGMTLASIRRIMELEREVAELKEEVERLRARVAELEGDGPR